MSPAAKVIQSAAESEAAGESWQPSSATWPDASSSAGDVPTGVELALRVGSTVGVGSG
jgi:hypothetical protein